METIEPRSPTLYFDPDLHPEDTLKTEEEDSTTKASKYCNIADQDIATSQYQYLSISIS